MTTGRYSIRRRLLVALAAGFALLIAAAAVAADGVVRDRLTEEFDGALVARARALVALTEEEEGRIEFDYRPGAMPEFERAEEPDHFQFWLDDGRSLLRSARLTEDLPRAPAGAPNGSVRDVTLPDGRAARIVEIAFQPADPEPDEDEDENETPTEAAAVPGVVVAVAHGRGSLDALLGGLRLGFLGIGGIAILLGAFLVQRVLAAGFRPIESIATQVGALDADRLHARIALPRTPRELAPIVEQVNALLDRLAESFERERRFTGNVAHELRTPIAELRSLAEVGGKWPGDEASIVAFFSDVRDVAGRMERVIADLLLLARCQAGVERVATAPTSLRPVVERAWAGVAERARAADLRLELDFAKDLVVESDPGKLAIVCANLLGNAVSYARPGSVIRCAAAVDGDSFRLEFTNAAEPLSRAELASLAEPFWRKDVARSSADHAGLGLSVVAALARILRLDLGFAQDRDGTFRVRLRGGVS